MKKPDIVDVDFEATFDKEEKVWTVKYHWNSLGEPSLTTNVGEYHTKLDPEKRAKYEKEVVRWIDEGILVPWDGEVGGLLPLMAVEQDTKNKVRPVLDF